jgi:CheY-like chemotaxis protein
LGGLIAIVEDEPELQALYRIMLESRGHDIAYVSASADDAVSKYARCARRPDLVIVDGRLADSSSGVDAARRILAADPCARILFATADAEAGRMAGRPGVLGVLQKPFSMGAMLGAIDGALSSEGATLTPGERLSYYA